MQVEEVDIDDEFLETMIERCYSVDQYITVRDSGVKYATLRYGKYTYDKGFGEVGEKKSLRALKVIFMGLINLYMRFEHEGYNHYYSNGRWIRIKKNKPQS